jgi:hypothetical protein
MMGYLSQNAVNKAVGDTSSQARLTLPEHGNVVDAITEWQFYPKVMRH